ncbi:hypothetical protein HHK36_000431 [Tetracentron sinense]|uniref:Uncharacterized protein n=1 Tax=Tetracentron sinense TaxID=13715 RepID=A0A834ZU33_TETSI|nr:hypothetical protein HHK36_000431 [Tetracentron sinense]
MVAEKFIKRGGIIFFLGGIFRIYNNAYYAKVGRIKGKEMNCLEMHFLFGLSFKLCVTPTTVDTYCFNLYREMWLQQPFLCIARSLKPCFWLAEEEESMHQPFCNS